MPCTKPMPGPPQSHTCTTNQVHSHNHSSSYLLMRSTQSHNHKGRGPEAEVCRGGGGLWHVGSQTPSHPNPSLSVRWHNHHIRP
mmetsp:Transcript_31055/g.68950  ORF Transcript_31055/g.68950 Transcript_31055/m.68950 type:complete len:84 (+) Transcript_31055:776-1027(+)